MTSNKKNPMLGKLGKHKVSGEYLHINKLSDVDHKVLATLIEKSFEHCMKTYI